MSQLAEPFQDVSNSGWTLVPASVPGQPATVSARIGEAVADDDNTYVLSNSNPQGNLFEVKFAGVAVPIANQEGQLTVRLRSSDGGIVPVTLLLLQGSRLLAYKVVTPAQAYGNEVISLSAAVLESITDFSDLRLRVVAGNIQTACCPSPTPPILHLAFSNGTGACSCLNGQTVVLAWEGTHWDSGPISLCGIATHLNLSCQAGTWYIGGDNACSPTQNVPDSISCDPFVLTWNAAAMQGCCTDTVHLVVME